MSETTTIAVQGMTCGHCAMSVREAVQPLTGVNYATEQARVTSGGTDPADLIAAVEAAGYVRIGCHQPGHYEAGRVLDVTVT